MKLRQSIVLVPFFVLTAFTTAAYGQQRHTLVAGLVTWIGYGPFFIAQEKGFFDAEGITVNIRVMDGPGEREAAFASGQIDLFPNTPDAFTIFAAQGTAGKMVMPLDESRGADGLIARSSIKSISDLKGKTIGFQSGITSHFFLLYELDKVGLRAKDVIQQNMEAGDAGAAFLAKRLDAAVTWEPWLSKARQDPDSRVLATSAETPGLLVSSMMLKPRLLSARRADVLAFMRAWYKAVDFLNSNPEESRNIIGKAFALKDDEVGEQLQTVHLLTLQEAKAYYGRTGALGPVAQSFDKAVELYSRERVIKKRPNMEELIDPTLLIEIK